MFWFRFAVFTKDGEKNAALFTTEAPSADMASYITLSMIASKTKKHGELDNILPLRGPYEHEAKMHEDIAAIAQMTGVTIKPG